MSNKLHSAYYWVYSGVITKNHNPKDHAMRVARIATALLATAAAALLLTGCGSVNEHAVTRGPAPATVEATHSAEELPAASAPPATTAAAAPASPGTALNYIETNHGAGIVTVWTAEWATSNQSSPMTDKTPKNGAYLVVDVSFEGVGGTIGTSPLNWSVKDAAGHKYTYDMFGPEPRLAGEQLLTGEISRGFIGFDIPQGPVTLSMAPGFDGAVARWVIPA